MIKFLDYLVGSIIAAGVLTVIYLFIRFAPFEAKLVVGFVTLILSLLAYIDARVEGILK